MRVLLVLLLCLPGIATAGYLGDPFGVVAESSGAVDRARGSAVVPVTVGTAIALGDRVTTAERALARVIMTNKYTVTVRELSTVTFSDEVVDLQRGMVRVKYAHYSKTPLPVRTPYAIAAIRGSDGIFALKDETLVVTGIDGQIDLCKELIQQFDQVIATKTCQVTRRRMQVAEWATYIAWSEQALRVSDLAWKSLYLPLPPVLIAPPVTGASVSTSQFQLQRSIQHQQQSSGGGGGD